ncbi:unnamed protein product [Acanthoscelides obtectus]|uniref:Secreted protein n=1 Tax=Acanthoscelides obtectus TaxID=200917 RepID=A0A9P0M6V1_ACAOB|nr:unnamed protein product [Acanthoscelides obtectus]CAK1643036.1 hypothetical protein AOBTE_LOCUS13383 [Acanthoscelides obtectus]
MNAGNFTFLFRQSICLIFFANNSTATVTNTNFESVLIIPLYCTPLLRCPLSMFYLASAKSQFVGLSMSCGPRNSPSNSVTPQST